MVVNIVLFCSFIIEKFFKKIVPVLWLRASEAVRDVQGEKRAPDRQLNHRHLSQRHMRTRQLNSIWLRRLLVARGSGSVSNQ